MKFRIFTIAFYWELPFPPQKITFQCITQRRESRDSLRTIELSLMRKKISIKMQDLTGIIGSCDAEHSF